MERYRDTRFILSFTLLRNFVLQFYTTRHSSSHLDPLPINVLRVNVKLNARGVHSRQIAADELIVRSRNNSNVSLIVSVGGNKSKR